MNFDNPSEQKNVISVFYGIDKGEKIPDGYFAESFNMTSSKYPCLASRSERAKMVYEEGIMAPGEPVTAIEYNGGLILACGNGMIMHEDKTVDGCNKTKDIVQFGDQVYCAPSGLLIKKGFSEFAFSEARLYGAFNITFCDSAFSDITVTSGDKPTSPTNGQYWYDSENKGLYKYSTASSEWITVPVIYVKLASDEYDFSVFNEGDALTVINEEEPVESFVSAVFDGSIILEGVFNSGIIAEKKSLFIERRFPTIQHICVHNNRVWGCNYSENVNEIYASKLGDPLNWYCYRGIATDSYAVSCGDPGKFTGCTELGDVVVFFKENCIYTIYGTAPSNFQTVKTDCFGVQEGSEKSICRINGQVYYKSCHGVMRLSEGSLPVCISDELGADIWSDAVAGTDGRKYYIVMTDIKGKREMFVYDTKYKLWHKEDLPCEDIFAFMTYKNNLLCIGKTETNIPAKAERLSIIEEAPDRTNYNDLYSYLIAVMDFNVNNVFNKGVFHLTDEEIRQLRAAEVGVEVSEISNEDLYAYMSSFMILHNTFEHKLNFAYITNELTCNAYLPVVDGESAVQKNEGRFLWEVQTGIRGFETSEYKRLKSVEIRMKLMEGSKCNVDVEYDGNGPWKSVGSFDTPGMTTFRTTVRFNKCDTFRLKFYGYGDVVIYSIAEIYEEVGEVGV